MSDQLSIPRVVAPTRRLGDFPVFPIALGGASWSMTDLPSEGARPPDEELARRTIDAALDVGVRLIDTARAYTSAHHPGHSEALIAQALREHPLAPEVVVATKGGHYRDGNEFPIDARPEAIRQDCARSRQLLGVERIDLYQLHWPDPTVPLRSTMSAFAELRDAGLIRDVGLSNVSIVQLEEAQSVVPIVSVENQFSPFDQRDKPMVDYCERHSIAYLAYSPLRGRPPGAEPIPLSDAFPGAAAVAQRRGISVQQVALAWLLQLSPAIIPICGASRPATILDCAQAAAVALDDSELVECAFSELPS